jgi:hypothetical protein
MPSPRWQLLLLLLLLLAATAGSTAIPTSCSGRDVGDGSVCEAGEEGADSDWHIELEIRYPLTGHVYPSGVDVQPSYAIHSRAAFSSESLSLCYIHNDRAHSCEKWAAVQSGKVFLTKLHIGSHQFWAWVIDDTGRNVTRHASVVDFEVIDSESMSVTQHSLLEWYYSAGSDIVPLSSATEEEAAAATSSFLVVVVKSQAQNFDFRQAIRGAWGMLAKTAGVDLWFAIGIPKGDFSYLLGSALKAESAAFGDILTDHLIPEVEDSYEKLVEKSKAAIAFVVREYPGHEYLLMTDDDAYVDILQLVTFLREAAPPGGLYAGQVWEEQFGHPVAPVRLTGHKNYVSEVEWPFQSFFPFALGSHVILSKDCAQFVAANSAQLAAVGTLEDVSLSLWMRIIGIRPLHLPFFTNARDLDCTEGSLSIADLSPAGITAAHMNIMARRPLCSGYDRLKWIRW